MSEGSNALKKREGRWAGAGPGVKHSGQRWSRCCRKTPRRSGSGPRGYARLGRAGQGAAGDGNLAGQYVRDQLRGCEVQVIQRRCRPEQGSGRQEGLDLDCITNRGGIFKTHNRLDCIILPFRSPSIDSFFPLHLTENETSLKWPQRLYMIWSRPNSPGSSYSSVIKIRAGHNALSGPLIPNSSAQGSQRPPGLAFHSFPALRSHSHISSRLRTHFLPAALATPHELHPLLGHSPPP